MLNNNSKSLKAIFGLHASTGNKQCKLYSRFPKLLIPSRAILQWATSKGDLCRADDAFISNINLGIRSLQSLSKKRKGENIAANSHPVSVSASLPDLKSAAKMSAEQKMKRKRRKSSAQEPGAYGSTTEKHHVFPARSCFPCMHTSRIVLKLSEVRHSCF